MKFRLVQVWLSERILAGNAYCYRVSRNFEHTLCLGLVYAILKDEILSPKCKNWVSFEKFREIAPQLTIGTRNLKMDFKKAVIIEVKVDTLLCNSKMLISK